MNELDRRIFEFLYSLSHRSDSLDLLFIFLSKTLPWIIGLWVLWTIFSKRDWGNNKPLWKNRFQYFSLGLISVIFSKGIIANLLSSFINNPRPFVALEINPLINHVAVGSFPSGHMSFLIPLVLLMFMLSKKVGWWSLILALLVGISRIIVGIHWPLDILGGIGVGLFSFLVAKVIFEKKKLV